MTGEDEMADDLPPEDRRREIFAALVAAQDGGLSVLASRKKIAGEFGLTAEQVEKIEREGLEAQWPPLVASREQDVGGEG